MPDLLQRYVRWGVFQWGRHCANNRAMADALTEKEIAELIESLFVVVPDLVPLRVKTDQGVGLRFAAKGKIGRVVIIYPLPEAISALHESLEHDKNVTRVALWEVGRQIRNCIFFGVENVFDVALFQVRQRNYELESADKSPRPYNPKELNRARLKVLKELDARNKKLVPAPKGGKQQTVTPRRIHAAIAKLKGEGMSIDSITAAGVALRLGCTESAIYKAVSRAGGDWQTIIEMNRN